MLKPGSRHVGANRVYAESCANVTVRTRLIRAMMDRRSRCLSFSAQNQQRRSPMPPLPQMEHTVKGDRASKQTIQWRVSFAQTLPEFHIKCVSIRRIEELRDSIRCAIEALYVNQSLLSSIREKSTERSSFRRKKIQMNEK